MIRIIVAVAIVMAIMAAASGCATTNGMGTPGAVPGSAPGSVPGAAPSNQKDIWPKIYKDESWLVSFESDWSEEQAVGNIRNLQTSMVEHNANVPIGDLNVDPYGMRARWTWIEGGYQKSSGFVVPFDQVTSMLLERYPAIDKDYKWGILIYIEGSQPVSIRTPTREAAERLGKAVYALARARKARLNMPNARVGAALGSLSAEQAQAAGILKTDGIIVSWTFRDGPAERAGFSPQDIITGIGDRKVQKTEDFFGMVEAAAAAGAREIRVFGLRRSYRAEKNALVEVFVPVAYSFPLAADDAAKGAPQAAGPTQAAPPQAAAPQYTAPNQLALAPYGLLPQGYAAIRPVEQVSVKPAWTIEQQQTAAKAEEVKNAFGAFFIGYDYPIVSGALAPHLTARMGMVNFSLGMETATSAGSSFLSGIEGEFLLNITDRGSLFAFNDMGMLGYSIALAPLRLNLGLRFGLSMLDVTDDVSAAHNYTALGLIAGPEASLYLALDPTLWLFVRGRYAWASYMTISGSTSNPIATGDNSANFTSLQAGLAFKL